MRHRVTTDPRWLCCTCICASKRESPLSTETERKCRKPLCHTADNLNVRSVLSFYKPTVTQRGKTNTNRSLLTVFKSQQRVATLRIKSYNCKKKKKRHAFWQKSVLLFLTLRCCSSHYWSLSSWCAVYLQATCSLRLAGKAVEKFKPPPTKKNPTITVELIACLLQFSFNVCYCFLFRYLLSPNIHRPHK